MRLPAPVEGGFAQTDDGRRVAERVVESSPELAAFKAIGLQRQKANPADPRLLHRGTADACGTGLARAFAEAADYIDFGAFHQVGSSSCFRRGL